MFLRLAAFYHSSSGFICGGSLISAKLVVTAAHCVQNKNEQVRRRAEDSTFYLGKHNLETLFEPNIVVAGVTDLIVHPNWNINDDHFDADIAIAVLLNHVPFSKFIRPICIWTETSSYEDMIGQNGVVTGWGKTEFDAISTPAPRFTDLPVVSLVTCLQSNKAFNDLTSDRTFCAGKTSDMRGPCSGDSGESRGISVDFRNIIQIHLIYIGGGFIIKSGDKWYLRGIVSSSLYDNELMTCDSKNYVIFTDVTQFTRWIQRYMEIYP